MSDVTYLVPAADYLCWNKTEMECTDSLAIKTLSPYLQWPVSTDMFGNYLGGKQNVTNSAES